MGDGERETDMGWGGEGDRERRKETDGETSERGKGVGRLRAGECGLGEWRQKKRNKK